MIMHVKPKRAWSALGWVTATVRYKIGGSVVTPRFVGLLHRHKGYGGVCPWTTVEIVWCRYGRACTEITVGVVGWRGARLSERTHTKLRDKASLRRGKWSDQFMRNLYCLASELAFLVMWKSLPHDHTS